MRHIRTQIPPVLDFSLVPGGRPPWWRGRGRPLESASLQGNGDPQSAPPLLPAAPVSICPPFSLSFVRSAFMPHHFFPSLSLGLQAWFSFVPSSLCLGFLSFQFTPSPFLNFPPIKCFSVTFYIPIYHLPSSLPTTYLHAYPSSPLFQAPSVDISVSPPTSLSAPTAPLCCFPPPLPQSCISQNPARSRSESKAPCPSVQLTHS